MQYDDNPGLGSPRERGRARRFLPSSVRGMMPQLGGGRCKRHPHSTFFVSATSFFMESFASPNSIRVRGS